MQNQSRFNLDALYHKHPEFQAIIGSNGKDKRFRNNIFEKVELFSTEKINNDDLSIVGVIRNKRQWRFFPKEFTDLTQGNLYKWKVIIGAIKSKFFRTMLGVLKITQHNEIGTFRLVPLQDFTPASDIDWSKSIPEIDQQLYAKYGLDAAEIEFIETHVKEMS